MYRKEQSEQVQSIDEEKRLREDTDHFQLHIKLRLREKTT
jgi:hypothetical protein